MGQHTVNLEVHDVTVDGSDPLGVLGEANTVACHGVPAAHRHYLAV